MEPSAPQEGESDCAHIESLGSASDVPALCDIVETREALLVQDGVEESQSGQPDAQPIVVQEGNQSGHDWGRYRSSSSGQNVPNPEVPVADRESGNVGDPLQVSPWRLHNEISHQKRCSAAGAQNEVCLHDRTFKRDHHVSEQNK